MRRVIAVICVGVAFAASAAIAVAQNESLNGDNRSAGVEVVFPDSLKGREEAMERAVQLDRAEVDAAKVGPTIGPGEIHVPDEPVDEELVEFCDEVVENETDDAQRLCKAVVLADADRLSGGVYTGRAVESRYEKLVQSEGGAK